MSECAENCGSISRCDIFDFMARYAPNRPAQVVYKDKVYMETRHQYVEPDIVNIIETKFIYGNRARHYTSHFHSCRNPGIFRSDEHWRSECHEDQSCKANS